MSVITKVSPTRHMNRGHFLLLALVLVLAGLCCSDLSAGLLDKLKKQLGSEDQQEQTLDSEDVGAAGGGNEAGGGKRHGWHLLLPGIRAALCHLTGDG